MANLSLRHVYKVYPNGTKAVNDFNMEIGDKEFIVFVGPSGCGKSTTLRMIAGLEEISAGELYIDDQLVNDVEPKDRDISMVFQNYALYPHMTVYDNMAFGLKLRHVPQEEIHKKVLWAAKILKLTDYLDRKPRAMSGGQRQRVALGRAILRNPKVFLLDEPLSNLDAKLRTEMRAEITKLHQTLGTTFIYVTHDQVEAMTLGSRVVVMKLGYVQQIDTPQNLYNYPINKFVAGFIGTPQMNFFEATLLRKGKNVQIDFKGCGGSLTVDFNELIKVNPGYLKGDKVVTVGLRCENISIDPEVVNKSSNKMVVKVSHFEELGSETLIYGNLNVNADSFEENNTNVIIKTRNKGDIKAGDIINASFDMSKAHYFDNDTEESIALRIPTTNVFDSEIKDCAVDFLGHKLSLPPFLARKDVSSVELFVPTNAISFGGDIKAKVVEIEQINKTKVIHLQIGERIFFVVGDYDVKVGETVNIDVDIKQIEVKKDNEVIIKKLQKRNIFVGSYTNAVNNKRSVKTICNYYNEIAKKEISSLERKKNLEIGELGLNNLLLKEYKQEFKEKKENAQAELSLALGTLELGKEGKQRVKKECKNKINAAKLEYNEKVAKFKEIRSNVVETEELKQKAEEISRVYDKQIQDIKANLEAHIKEYEEGKIEYAEMLKNSVQEEKDFYRVELEKLDLNHDKILDEYALKINSEADQGKIESLKKEVKDINEKYLLDKDALITQSKMFFMNINGYYQKSQYEITKKIVQALGVGIFNVNYRYEISVDSMHISKKGIKLEVFEMLDYGKDKFILGKAHEAKIIVKADKQYKPGEIIYVDFDLKDIHVYENKFDIRLY